MRRAIAAALLVTALASCGGGSTDTLAPGSTLRIGYSFPFDTADLAGRIAFERFGQQRHVKVRIVQLTGAPATVSALLRGDIDLASLNLPDAIKAIGQGARLHVILGSKMEPEYVYVARPGIAGVAQLKGRHIGIQGHGSDTEAFTKLLLQHGGLSLGDAQINTIPNSTARAAALTSGRIDATALRYHEYLRLRRKLGGLHALAQMRQFEPGRITQVWVVTDAFAKRNARRIQTMVSDALVSYTSTYTSQGRVAWMAAGAPDLFRGEPSSIPTATYAFYRRIGMWPRRQAPITAASGQKA